MVAPPAILAAPAILHQDDQYVIWHAGVVASPTGVIMLHLEVNPVGSRRELITDAEWRWQHETARSSIETKILFRDQSAPILARSGGYGTTTGRSGIQLQRWFPAIATERLAGAALHIEVRPLDLHLTINLDPQ